MIYYVEDDDNIRDLTVYALRKQGIEAEGFSCDGEFKAAVARRVPDAVLLDIMLPDTDGLAIMRRLRADRLTAMVPIMMLTAKDTELDKVMALDGGADDYLTKPFSLMELASRCRALLRRGGMVKQASDVLSVGDIVLSPSHREVTVAGEPLKLTLREFDLLEYLMRKPGVVFTRESLLQSVWGWDFDGGSRTVDVHVQTLRQKLGEHAGAIETVRGVGYRLAEPSTGDGAEGDDAGLAQESAQLLLQLQVHLQRAVEEPGAGAAGAVLLQRPDTGLHHLRVGGQPQIVVGAKHDAALALHHDLHILAGLEGVEVGVYALFL